MIQRVVKVFLPMLIIGQIAVSTSETHEVEETANNDTDICENRPAPIVSSSNNLGFFLAESIANKSNNFFSPLGLSMAFGMAYLGANGNTAKEMEDTLGYSSFNISNNQVHEGIKELCESTAQQADEDGYTITISNALFRHSEIDISEEFVHGIHNYYHGDVLSTDFSHQPEESVAVINNWVQEKTSHKITKLFDDPLPAETAAILTNAIYFKGTWKTEFPEGRNYDGRFYTNDNPEGINVPMMSLANEKFPYLQDDTIGYKFVELPYKGGKVHMLFALPLDFNEEPNLVLNSELLCRIQSQMVETKLDSVDIPKFKFAYEKKLKGTMMTLGMIDAFTSGAADFSGINSNSSFYISDVIHKAVIEVNEKGSEAAAVSGVMIMPLSIRDVPIFIANHPFLFYIIHNPSKTVLFSGKMMDPSAVSS